MILIEKTTNREAFIEKAFEQAKIYEFIKDKEKVFIKPNIVSSEEYPTTTHPFTLQKCLELLLKHKNKESILVGDGPAFDAGDSQEIIENHPLKKVADNFGVKFINLNKAPKIKKKIQGLTFEIAKPVLEADFIISLPVLKTHKICKITGAMKNQYGVLSPKNKLKYHLPLYNIHKAIVLLNKLINVDFWIVDAIETMISAQERRHGGRKAKLGYMLAGTNPLELDIEGFNLLKKVDPGLKNLESDDVPQIKWAKKIFYNL